MCNIHLDRLPILAHSPDFCQAQNSGGDFFLRHLVTKITENADSELRHAGMLSNECLIPLWPGKYVTSFFSNNNKPRLILHVCRRTNFSGANLFIIHHDCDIAVHVLFSDPNILSSSTLLTAEVSRDDGDVQSSREHLDREKPVFSP